MVSAVGTAKRVLKKPRAKPEISAATLSSDGIARQVTRSEFMELVNIVAQLKKQSQKHTAVEAQVGADLELFGAQVASNKSALGKLAEMVIEKTQQLHESTKKHLQQLQVESDRRLTDIQLALERLEFRFKHHVRDCQTIAEQVDLHQSSMQQIKSQIGQTKIALEKQAEEQQAFIETAQYTSKTAEERLIAISAECTNTLEAFQQRMVKFVKGVEESTQESIAVVIAQTRDLEIHAKRHKNLLHQYLDEQVGLRQTVLECEAKLSQFGHDQEDLTRTQREGAARVESLESKLGKLLLLVERKVERADAEQLVERSEQNLKTRIEAVLDLVELCVQGRAS